MFRFFCYLSMSGKIKGTPKGYYRIDTDPSYRMGYGEELICRQQNPSFDEILRCLKKCWTKADYLGCYSMIYWKYYEEFYEWIQKSIASDNTANIRIIKKFYKKALCRWLKFIEHSDDTFYPQNGYFRLMQKEIEKICKGNMKKVFYQFGAWAFGIYSLSLTMIILMVISAFGPFDFLLKRIAYVILLLYPLGLGIHTIIYNAYYRAIFQDHMIFLTGQLGKDDGGHNTAIYQYKDAIDMRDIQNVNLVFANTDSRKKVRKYAGLGSLRPMLYFEFVLTDETTKWMWITPFSKNQRKKMLSIINDQASLELTYDKLIEYDYSMFRRKKK